MCDMTHMMRSSVGGGIEVCVCEVEELRRTLMDRSNDATCDHVAARELEAQVSQSTHAFTNFIILISRTPARTLSLH